MRGATSPLIQKRNGEIKMTKTMKKNNVEVTVLESVKTEGTEVIEFGNGGQLYTTPAWNPFLFNHGRSTYAVRGFKFYNEDGVQIGFNSGWFGSNNAHGSMAFKKGDKAVDIKKKKEERFDTSEVYFVSQGKDWSGYNNAIIYVPMSYLSNMGYERVKTVRDSEFETFTQVTLKTPKFSDTLWCKNEKKFDKQKAEFMKQAQEASTPEELKEVIKAWEWKF
jgi:hypothetical protein